MYNVIKTTQTLTRVPGIAEGNKRHRYNQNVERQEGEVDFALPLVGVSAALAAELHRAVRPDVHRLDEDEELRDGEEERQDPGQGDELLGSGRRGPVLEGLADRQVSTGSDETSGYVTDNVNTNFRDGLQIARYLQDWMKQAGI